jgi:phage shock protein PspC (stress-responsive transcriptional regulator)
MHRMIGGVVGGLEEYFGFDPVLARELCIQQRSLESLSTLCF